MGLFRRAKGVLSEMARYTHMQPLSFAKGEKPLWADNTVYLSVMLGDKKIGDLALLSKKAALDCGIKVLSVVLVELDMDALIPLASRTNRYVRLPEYPVTEYDISALVDATVTWEEITAAVPLTEANRKPPRGMRRYNYCPDMRPTEALVLSITNADGDCEVMLSPDEKMTAILQAPHPAVPDYDPAATEEQTAEE